MNDLIIFWNIFDGFGDSNWIELHDCFYCYRLPIASGCVPWCCQCGWTGSALSRAAVSVTKWNDPVRISYQQRRRAPVANTLENLHFFASVLTAIHFHFPQHPQNAKQTLQYPSKSLSISFLHCQRFLIIHFD